VQSGDDFYVMTAGGKTNCPKYGKLNLQIVGANGESDKIVLENVRVCPVLPVPLVSLDDFLGSKYYIVGRGSKNTAKSYVASEDGTIRIPLIQRDKLYLLSTQRPTAADCG